MEFVRSMPAPRESCNFGPREQINQITAWQDASNVYGRSVSAEHRNPGVITAPQ
jgi:peroxidase